MIVPDVERWKRISTLLDGLLDLPTVEREARLDVLRSHDPSLAGELAALMADAKRAEEACFLGGSAAGPPVDVASAAASLAGERIGAYVLETLLGQGGTGTVWRAHRADGRFEGAVAVKLLHLSLIGRTGALRFEREGAILARLSHPHIARLLDAGVTAGGQPYLVLELVEGERIDRHCDARHLSVAGRIALFRIVLDAVAHAHRHLVVHRDIKPSNILVDTDGSVKLLDFGIAKLLQDGDGTRLAELTGDGMRALTPDYAAPEQLRGDEVTTATDVYSLGVLLYLLLTGRHPTASAQASPADVIRATLDTDPSRLSTAVTATGDAPAEALARIADERDTSPVRLKRQLGGDLENIVAKALRKAPGERYASVDAFSDDLRRWAAGEPVSARASSLAYRSLRFVSRHRGAVAASALTIVAILAGLVGTVSQMRRAEQQSERATREAASARLERDNAQEQERLERGTSEFLQLVLRDAAGGDPGVIRKQLDRASALIAKTRFEHPIVKVALLRQTAGRYAELGDVGAGSALLRQAIEATQGTDLAAPASAVPVNLACSLARFLHEGGDPAGALRELDRADALMKAGAAVSLPGRVSCLQPRSLVESGQGHHAAALAIARDALQQLESAGIRQGEQHRVVRGVVLQALAASGRTSEAMAIARPLLAESVAGQGRESIGVLRRSSFVTRLTREGGDPLAALALSDADRADAARLQGAGRVDAQIELEHARVLLALGRHAEAGEAFARSAAAATAGGSVVHVLPSVLGETEALLRAGQLDKAQARFAALKPLRDAAGGPQRFDALLVEALLAGARGDTAASQVALEAAARVLGSPPEAADPKALALSLARGERALAEGRADADALADAERALAAARRSALAPERSSDVGRALLLRARLAAMAGRSDEARRDAALARASLAATLGPEQAETRAAAVLAGA